MRSATTSATLLLSAAAARVTVTSTPVAEPLTNTLKVASRLFSGQFQLADDHVRGVALVVVQDQRLVEVRERGGGGELVAWLGVAQEDASRLRLPCSFTDLRAWSGRRKSGMDASSTLKFSGIPRLKKTSVRSSEKVRRLRGLVVHHIRDAQRLDQVRDHLLRGAEVRVVVRVDQLQRSSPRRVLSSVEDLFTLTL